MLAATVVLSLTGCGHGGTTSASSTPTSTSAAWTRPDAPPDPHTLVKAGATALAQVPGATLTFIESETADAGTWKVRLVTADGAEQQTKVGSDGVVVLVPPAPLSGDDADSATGRALVAGAKLDYRTAVDKTLSAVPNGSITQLSLIQTGGAPAWEAAVWDTYLVEHDVTIDAATGEITGNKQV